MSVGPRIVFTRFASGTAPKLRPWQEHIRRVAGALPTVVGTDDEKLSVIVWNLVSANNRDLGRGARIYQRFDEAVLDARAAIATKADLEIMMVSGDRDGVYGWSLSNQGLTEMVCSRWYQTDRDRRHSIEVALTALQSASLREGARLTHPSLMAGERRASDV